MVLIGLLGAISALGCFALALLATTTARTRAAVALRACAMLVTALGIGLPYYVPPGMFAVRFGGASSGVVSAWMDVVAFAISGAAIAALSPVLDSSFGWAKVWALLGVVALVSAAVNLRFLHVLLHARGAGGGWGAPQAQGGAGGTRSSESSATGAGIAENSSPPSDSRLHAL